MDKKLCRCGHEDFNHSDYKEFCKIWNCNCDIFTAQPKPMEESPTFMPETYVPTPLSTIESRPTPRQDEPNWEKDFDKIIGEIPDTATMEQYGKEFCFLCGHPTKNDKTVKEIKSFISELLASERQKERERVIREVEEMKVENATENPKLQHNSTINYIVARLKETKE